MENIMTTSLIYRLWKRLSDIFAASYFHKVLKVLLIWCKNSAIHKFILRYLSKNSSLKHSLTYRLFSKIFSFFDRLWDRLYAFGLRCGSTSSLISFIRNCFCTPDSFAAYGIIVLCFGIGFGAASLFLGAISTLKMVFSGFCIFTALLLFIGKPRWVSYLKGSLFWRFVRYVFD